MYPTVFWGSNRVTFLPADSPLPAEVPIPAALVFARHTGGFVVADITNRGWCVPGGRLEPGETPEQAVRRETWEETGATLGPLQRLGHFLLTDTQSQSVTAVTMFVGDVTYFAARPSGTESQGVRVLAWDELPQHYYMWDELLAAVFASALKVPPSSTP